MNEFIKLMQENFFRVVLGIVFVGFELLGAYLLLTQDDPKKPLIAISAGILCLFFIFLTRFKHFEARWLGIKGELWEDKQKEAVSLIKQLKGISPALAACSYSSLMAVGRFAGALPNEARFQMAEELQDQLIEIGVPLRKLQDARRHFDRLFLVDMSSPMWEKIRKHFWELQTDLNKKLGMVKQPIQPDDPVHNGLTKELRLLGAEVKRFEDARGDFKNNNTDVLERLFSFVSSSQYFPAGWFDSFKKEYQFNIENIQAYVERGEIPHPSVAFNDED